MGDSVRNCKLLQNLRAGLGLATCYRVRVVDFHCTVDQLAALIFLQIVLAFVFGFAAAESPRYFNWYAIYDYAIFAVALQSFAYVVARSSGRPWRVLTVSLMLLSESPAW